MTTFWVLVVCELIATTIWIFFLARGSYKSYQCDKEGMKRRALREDSEKKQTIHRLAVSELLRRDRARFVEPALKIVNDYFRKEKKIR